MVDSLSDSNPGLSRSRLIHVVMLGLLSLVFCWVMATRYFRPLVLDETIGVEPGAMAAVDTRIDPNTASKAELVTLPGVGDVTAERILEYREAQAGASADGQVFTRPEDLEAIRGIGPKTVERLAPLLRFSPPAGAD